MAHQAKISYHNTIKLLLIMYNFLKGISPKLHDVCVCVCVFKMFYKQLP